MRGECPLYQPAVILTYEDCQSSGRDWQPCGRFLVALELRRALVTMNHIATSDASCREPPKTVFIGQDHRRLVLLFTIHQKPTSSFPLKRERQASSLNDWHQAARSLTMNSRDA